MRISKTDFDIIVREIYDRLADWEDEQIIEIDLDDYTVIIKILTMSYGRSEIGGSYMSSYEIVNKSDTIITDITNVEIWDVEGNEVHDDLFVQKLRKEIL